MTRCALVRAGARLTWLALVVACSPDRGTIGAVLAQTGDQRLVLREVPETLAAGRAGLQPGDELLLIDGRDVRELDPRGVHQALSGTLGEPVKLTLLRDGRVIRVTLRRTPAVKAAPRSQGERQDESRGGG
ncbi:MAG TPA: PDZ domain-containing protein [Polyangiaceae bacterium]|nr:PDZ domain-containing protein [Polyangiaceae bacterium]